MRIALLSIVLALFAAGASAETLSPEEEARSAFEDGKRQYNLGKFEVALERFSRAYELRPAPLLLFNIGQCHRHLKNHERAIFFFDGFLREAPDSEDRELVEGLIREERRLQAEAEAAAATPPPAPEVGAAPPPASPAVVDEAEPEGSWVPWAVGGGVVVVLAAAGVTAAVLATAPRGRQGFPAPTLGELDLRSGG